MAAPSDGTRTRPLPFLSGNVGRQVSPSGTVSTWNASVTGHQRTYSQRNLWTRSRKLLSSDRVKSSSKDRIRRQDFGGNFESTRHEFWSSHSSVNLRASWIGGDYQFAGSIYPIVLSNVGPSSGLWPLAPSDLGTTMVQKGATAIARTIPTNPAVGVGQFLGELRQGLVSVPGKDLIQALRKAQPGSSRPREIADKGAGEYLNYEFGIKPILSDIQGFVKATVDSEKIVQQLARDSGRLIRRRYSFPDERKIQIIKTDSPAFPWPSMHASMISGSGTRTLVRETKTRTWFSGAYTYHYPKGHSLWDKMRRAEQTANRLYGLRLSPALLWELAPWSWFVDWMGNHGDILTNVSALSRDGLVLCWGYVMCEVQITDTHTLSGLSFKGAGPGAVQTVFKTTVKKRLKATPYGFGMDPDWNDLSDRQLAILAALGITRASR